MNEIIDYFFSFEFLITLLFVVATIVFLYLIKKYLVKRFAYKQNGTKKNTSIGLFINVLQYLIVIVNIFIILKINGFNVNSIVTGFGIVATIVGLSLQDSIKSVIAGINIFSNNYYKVGDFVRYKDNICEVTYFSTSVSKFRNLCTDATYTVSNNTINNIEKIKNNFYIDFYVNIKADKKDVNECIVCSVAEIEAIYGVSEVKCQGLIGVDSFKGYGYRITYNSSPRFYYRGRSKIIDIVVDNFNKVDITVLVDGGMESKN